MRLSEQLREIEDGIMEVRMLMDVPGNTNFRYEIRNVTGPHSYRFCSTIYVKKNPFGYFVRQFSDISGERNSTLGFTFTRSGADRLAHKKAASLATRIANYTQLSVCDVSNTDKKELARRVDEIRERKEKK